jgi:hypothetical protein
VKTDGQVSDVGLTISILVMLSRSRFKSDKTKGLVRPVFSFLLIPKEVSSMSSRLLVGAVCLAMMGSAAQIWAGGKSFSNKSLKGTYSEKFSGFVGSTSNPFPTTSSLPQSGTGVETADGMGNFTASTVFSIGGSTCSGTIKGTYQVNADGTGTSTATFTPNPTAPIGVPASNYSCPTQVTGIQNEAFTIVEVGKLDFISTDADSVVVGTAERQKH